MMEISRDYFDNGAMALNYELQKGLPNKLQREQPERF